MPLADPSNLPDDELRPWTIDEDYEHEVSEAMSRFDETYAQTSYNRNAGCHSHSDLDKVRHDDIIDFAIQQEKAAQSLVGNDGTTNLMGDTNDGKGTDVSVEEGVDYMAVHDEDSGEPQMLHSNESDDEEDDEKNDSYVPLGDDRELLQMTSSMSNIDEDRLMKTHAMRVLLQKEKKKREAEFRSGNTAHLQSIALNKIPSAKYMPTHKTRVYNEWIEAQKELKKEAMKSKAYLLDRPTTAFINSLIDQEREILAESFKKQESLRTSTAEENLKRSQQIASEEQRNIKLKEFNEQKKCFDRFNKLYPDLKLQIPSSPIATGRPMTSGSGAGSRPATSDGQGMQDTRPMTSSGKINGRHSPLRPITSEGNRNGHFRKTKPSFDDKNLDMTLVLGLKDLTKSNFPTSNLNSIPSNNSAIVKYRTPREQMLDAITVTSKAEDDEAKRKANLRVKEANKALKNLQKENTKLNSGGGRFSPCRPATPLSKLGITPATGALNNNNVQTTTVFLKPPKNKVKKLRDLMKTTSGVDSRLFNKGFQTKIPYDAPAERQKNIAAAAYTKEVDNLDSTTDALINPGFFEAMGPEKIYLSESNKFHSADERHHKQLANREKSHVTPGDGIRKWAIESLSSGRKLFHSGGGGFHYS